MTYRTACAFICFALPALADPPTVDAVKIDGTRVSVTLSHPDTGWDDYADGWRIEAEDGTVIGTRELLHPHVNEQPFTRSLGNVASPDGVQSVTVRAVDSVHERGGAEIVVDLNGIN